MIAKSCLLAAAVALGLPALATAQNSARPGFSPDTSTPAASSAFAPNATITQAFDVVAGMPPCPVGWICTNNSTPLGTSNWFQGNPAVFPAQAGATNAYIGANFNSVAGANDISNWLISPAVQFGTGSELRFWSRVNTGSSVYPDRLEIRLSTTGSNTGGTNASTGDFSILLGTINPTLSNVAGSCVVPAAAPNATGYPETWCEYRLTTAQNIPLTGSGRIGFRYFVINGGTGANSNYIGIDTFSFVEGVVDVAPTFAYTPAAASTVTFTGGTTINSTGNASIAVAVATAGAGTGALATTTTTCTAPTAPFAGFAQTVTAVGAGAITGAPLTGTCTLGPVATTQTLTCSENRGGTPTAVTFNLDCPAGIALPLTSTPVSGSTVALPSQILGGPATTAPINFQNPDVVPVTVTCVAPTAPQFTVAPLSFPVPAGGNASTTVSFSSAAVGSFTGVLNCTAGQQAFTFNLTGTTGVVATAVPLLGNGTRSLLLLATLALGLITLGLYTRRN
ncbi:MAG: choice-of-anchor J domain-containing protein [Pseudomonadota bacterium]|nr:choice-of-anchor J domain-containing protein [Pseudomonadota bacterium]